MWTYLANVKRVVDGDTIDVTIDLGFGVSKSERLRIARIDAWETRGEERELGKIAKAFVEEELPVGKQVIVETQKKGKYGRYIAEVRYDGKNLSDLLLEHGHATKYPS